MDFRSVLKSPMIKFGGNLFRSIKESDKNVICSPMSVQMALNLVLAGAVSGSETEKELLSALNYDLSRNSIEDVNESYAKLGRMLLGVTARGREDKQAAEMGEYLEFRSPIIELWSLAITKDIQLLPGCKRYLDKHYNGSIETIPADNPEPTKKKILDFVNGWAEEAGFKKRILEKEELDKMNTNFPMLLLCAVYVQAFWYKKFCEQKIELLFYNYGQPDQVVKNSYGLTKRNTRCGLVEFVPDPSKSVIKWQTRALIAKYPDEMRELSMLNFRAIKIRLAGGVNYAIIEPFDQSKGNSLHKLADVLLASKSGEQASLLEKTLDILDNRMAQTDIEYLQMPQFKFETSLDLIEPLVKLGISRIFDRQGSELTKVTREKLFVGKISHDAVIEVNKLGLKAAAVTTVKMIVATNKPPTPEPDPIRVEVRNPFIFVIRFSKLPMFIGQLVHLG